MRAVVVDAFDAAPAVRDDLPDPTAAADGLVVRVRASSVNPVDNAIAAGMLREMVDTTFRLSSAVTTRAPLKRSARTSRVMRWATRFSASSCTQIPPFTKEAGPS
jgi:hypothetical protein